MKCILGHTRVARVSLADDIGGQGTDGRDGDVVGGLGSELGHDSWWQGESRWGSEKKGEGEK